MESLAIVFGPLMFHQEDDEENRDIANKVTHTLLERWSQLGEVLPAFYARAKSLHISDATKIVDVRDGRVVFCFVL